MSELRQIVREYVRATEALLKIDDLSDTEGQAIAHMLNGLSEKLLDNGES